jgi:hypothetical protein
LETNTSRSPSGDQRGWASLSPLVSRRGDSEPSSVAIQIDWRYSFASPSIDQTTYATSFAPGRTRGSLTPVSWKTSSALIPATSGNLPQSVPHLLGQ